LLKKNAKLEEDLLKKNEKLKEDHNNMCSELKSKIDALTAELETHEDNNDQLTEKLTNYESAITDAQENRNKLFAEKQRCREQQEENSNLKQDNEKVLNKYIELEQEMESMTEDHNMALENEQVQVEGLTGDLKELKKTNKELRRKVKTLSREKVESEESYKSLAVDFTRLKRQCLRDFCYTFY